VSEKDRIARLDALGSSLAGARREAIQYRKVSGIEQEWDEDDDAYNGVDEESKATASAFKTRPPGQFLIREPEDDYRSTEVLNITKPYVNAFASKIIDMRLQVNGRAWALSPTPVPELEEAKTQKHIGLVKDGQPIMVIDEGGQRQATVADMARRDMDFALKAAAKAQKQLDDWMAEGSWDAEARHAIDDMARIGTGVMKGPFPEKCSYFKLVDGVLTKAEKIKPRSKRISVRNLFPDPACGEDIHNGDYLWERDYLTRKRVRDLKGLRDSSGKPIYIAEQIDAVLDEGPRLPEVDYDNDKEDLAQKSRPFQIWYYTGTLSKEDIEAAGCSCEDKATVPAIVAMINNRVVRASLNPLDNGKFPYDVLPCSRREGHWAGVGIGRDLRTPQRMATGATRAMLENAGLSSKPIIALMQGLLVPSDGSNVLYGGKIFIIPKGTDIQEARNAIYTFQIESRQTENMNIIQFALKMSEDVTGLPMILQGQQGKAPDVLGVVQILDKNATSVANRVAKMYDDNLLEPHVKRYYDWLMQHSEDPEMKGDYTIDVLPPPDIVADKAALSEMTKLGEVKGSKVDPAKLFSEYAKSNRFDPVRIQYTDEEWEKIQKQPQPGDPRIEVAKIKAEADAKIESARQEFETAEAEKDRRLKIAIEMIDEELTTKELDAVKRTALEKVKAELAGTAMKLSVTKELAMADHRVNIHKHRNPTAPVIEPAGKAAPGKSFAH